MFTTRLSSDWMRVRGRLTAAFVVALAIGTPAAAITPPSQPGIDAPELARFGDLAVGVRTLTLVNRSQPDVLAFDPAKGAAPRRDRNLVVDIWYPATPRPGVPAETYTDSLTSEIPGQPATFSIPGVAIRDAPPAVGHYPLVVVSHGLSNVTIALSWLTENLASKGYVVAAIRHADAPYADRTAFPQAILYRPLDIAFVTRSLQRTLAADGLVDSARTALIGYSMGGYGALTCAGAILDPAAPLAKFVPGGLLAPYARGGAEREAVLVAGLRAVVAISPAGGSVAAWGDDGLSAVTAPLLLIAGDADRTVDYPTGARAFFDAATGSRRYLLTFKGAGHALGLGPAPESMRQRLWDLDWFEDPVWRKDRIIAINLHMITAFLDLFVKDDVSRAAYIDGLVPESSSGQWPAESVAQYGAYSPGTGGITVWKGFQRKHAEGLTFQARDPAAHAK